MGRRGGGGGRRGGGGGSIFGGGARKAAPPPQRAQRRTQPPPPAQTAPPPPAPMPAAAPPQQSSGGGMLSGLGGAVAQGMAMGTGSALAHQAVNRLMGGGSSGHDAARQDAQAPAPAQEASPQVQQSLDQSNDVCGLTQQDLYKCLQENSGDAGACQFYFDALRQCQDNQKASVF